MAVYKVEVFCSNAKLTAFIMNPVIKLIHSSLGKKYIMALSGIVLSGFVLGHMLGNLQVYLDPYWINAYGYKLHHLPYGLLWVVRFFLLACVAAHIWAAITLIKENRAARPHRYEVDATRKASYASRTMWMSGPIILLFILFHIAHYTTRNVPGQEFNQQIVMADGTELPLHVHLVHNGHKKVNEYGEVIVTHNVHGMMAAGFSHWWVSLFYIIAMGLLCLHLTHGVSSMFQSLGLRNEVWRKRLEYLSTAYGWVVFLGFISIPIATLIGTPMTNKLPSEYTAPAAHNEVINHANTTLYHD